MTIEIGIDDNTAPAMVVGLIVLQLPALARRDTGTDCPCAMGQVSLAERGRRADDGDDKRRDTIRKGGHAILTLHLRSSARGQLRLQFVVFTAVMLVGVGLVYNSFIQAGGQQRPHRLLPFYAFPEPGCIFDIPVGSIRNEPLPHVSRGITADEALRCYPPQVSPFYPVGWLGSIGAGLGIVGLIWVIVRWIGHESRSSHSAGRPDLASHWLFGAGLLIIACLTGLLALDIAFASWVLLGRNDRPTDVFDLFALGGLIAALPLLAAGGLFLLVGLTRAVAWRTSVDSTVC